MSSAAKQTGEILTAEECKGYFELGTQPLVDHFTAISESKSIDVLAKLLLADHKQRLAELDEQLEVFNTRIYAIQNMAAYTDMDPQEFEQQREKSIARLYEEIDAIEEQIDFVKYESARAENMNEQQMFEYKNLANTFLSARQRVLDTWEANYNADPLAVMDDLDDETIAVPVDGRDIGTWINDLLNKALVENFDDTDQTSGGKV